MVNQRCCSSMFDSTNTNNITNTMNIINTKAAPIWPMYRILNPLGIIEGFTDFEPDKDETIRMYTYMNKIQVLDDILYNTQRQGRISFYMQNSGEEATQIGSASSLTLNDVILAQYREAGVLLWRGFTFQQAIDQCFSTADDLGKGRQMPVHYGSKELNVQTISSPLTTQLPQAVGAAYALKLRNAKITDPDLRAVVCCYFGEGAASEGKLYTTDRMCSRLYRTLHIEYTSFSRKSHTPTYR